MDYPYVSQGKTTIPGVNDDLEALITDVSTLDVYPVQTVHKGSAHFAKFE